MGQRKGKYHKYIETPEKMWEYFEAYKSTVKDRPILKHDFVGKDADEVERKLERPLTFEGFQNYLADNNIISDVTDYFDNRTKAYDDYVQVCARIKRTIRQDQIEGGMVGIYNPAITQRLNGLVEKTENKNENINKNFKLTMKL
jgi:hypothetical protein